jgi:hypothetical protein
MDPNKNVDNTGNNPYRTPIFRRISAPYSAGKDLTHTGLVMEWWKQQRLGFVDIYHHTPPKVAGICSLRQSVFRADQFTIAVEAPAYSVVDADGKKYLPLDTLFVALFESGLANRRLLEAVKEFPHPEQELSKWQPSPQRGNLVEELEDLGFELYTCDAVLKHRGRHVLQIMWWANPKCPIHAAEIHLSLKPELKAEWVTKQVPSFASLFTKELIQTHPDPAKILTPAGLEHYKRLDETYLD